MRKTNYILTFAGFALLLIAPLLGQALGQLYLILLGGMETNQFLHILQSSTLSLQIIGALIATHGLFARKSGKNNKC